MTETPALSSLEPISSLVPLPALQDTKPATETTIGRRCRTQKYKYVDVADLLDCVEELLPLVHNEWAKEAASFNELCREKERLVQNMESIMNKFDRLEDLKKKTGDPTCPPTSDGPNKFRRKYAGGLRQLQLMSQTERMRYFLSVF